MVNAACLKRCWAVARSRRASGTASKQAKQHSAQRESIERARLGGRKPRRYSPGRERQASRVTRDRAAAARAPARPAASAARPPLPAPHVKPRTAQADTFTLPVPT
eukprot:6173804-Pleurochrysis_carterae.AAC.1